MTESTSKCYFFSFLYEQIEQARYRDAYLRNRDICRSADGRNDVEEAVDWMEEMALEALSEVKDIIEREPIIMRLIQEKESHIRSLQKWNKDEVEPEIKITTDKLIGQLTNSVDYYKSQLGTEAGDKRWRRSVPYIRAAEHIAHMLELDGVKNAPFLSCCVMWYSGFNELAKEMAVICPGKDPIGLYNERSTGTKLSELKRIDDTLRKRFKHYEKWYLEERKRTLSMVPDQYYSEWAEELSLFWSEYLGNEVVIGKEWVRSIFDREPVTLAEWNDVPRKKRTSKRAMEIQRVVREEGERLSAVKNRLNSGRIWAC